MPHGGGAAEGRGRRQGQGRGGGVLPDTLGHDHHRGGRAGCGDGEYGSGG